MELSLNLAPTWQTAVTPSDNGCFREEMHPDSHESPSQKDGFYAGIQMQRVSSRSLPCPQELATALRSCHSCHCSAAGACAAWGQASSLAYSLILSEGRALD